MKGIKASNMRKIPPFSQSELLDFYASGRLPARMQDAWEARRDRILSEWGARPEITIDGEDDNREE